jgi:hypothetical protein
MFLNDLGICCEIAFNGTIGLIREQVMAYICKQQKIGIPIVGVP